MASDDWAPLQIGQRGAGLIDPDIVFKLWKTPLDFYYRECGSFIFPNSIHPQESGKPHVQFMQERLIKGWTWYRLPLSPLMYEIIPYWGGRHDKDEGRQAGWGVFEWGQCLKNVELGGRRTLIMRRSALSAFHATAT